jgi:energy-coupling factor transporter transmembrane protein EcfT
MAFLAFVAIIILLWLFQRAFRGLLQVVGEYSPSVPKDDYFVLTGRFPSSGISQKQKEIIEFLVSSKKATYDEIELAVECHLSDVQDLLDRRILFMHKRQKTTTHKNFWLAIGLFVGLLMLFVLADYYLMIRLNARYIGIFFYIAVFLLLLISLLQQIGILSGKRTRTTVFVIVSTILLISIFYFIFGGRTYFHASDYAKLIQVNEEQFTSDVKTVDVDTLPIVDKAYGEKLGSLKLGEYPGIGSEFAIGAYSDIIYQNKQYLVAPLEYRGLFKWLNNKTDGTPGYIMIDKVTAETTLVNLKENSGEGLRFTPSAFFDQDLVRHTYLNGGYRYQLEQMFFEIDDSGHPYYVLQYSLPTIFINGGRDIVTIAVVDAIDGEVTFYEPSEVPDWIESVYPSELLLTQLSYWGSLQDGWLNCVFTQRGVLRPSNGKRTIMNDGQLYYFTGLTSAGSDESTVGFVYMNTRTKDTLLFQFSGATENAAMKKALTLLPQNNISTSFPIPINVSDTPTYFIAIKGDDGRILRYVFMSVQDLELYGIAETKNQAYSIYVQRLSSVSTDNLVEITGILTDLTSYVLDGNTIYWIQINGSEWYMVDVSLFDSSQMRQFISLSIGDTLTIFVQDFNVIEMNLP